MVGTSFTDKPFSPLLTLYSEKKRGMSWKEDVKTVVSLSTRIISVDRGRRRDFTLSVWATSS